MELKIDDIEVNYIDEGNGQVVLILHGWGANIQSVLPIVNILKDKCRVIAIDLPGFGESQNPKYAFDCFDYAQFVKKFIDILVLKELVIVGHSNGGKIACILASKYKDTVKKLILIDSTGINPKRTFKYYYNVYKFKIIKKIYNFYSIITKNKDVLNKLYSKYGSDDYKNAKGIMKKVIVKVLNSNIEYLLKDIECSTLLIWGENDMSTPLYMAEKMNKLISDSGLVVLKGASHFSYVDDFITFKAVVFSFLYCDINLNKGVMK